MPSSSEQTFGNRLQHGRDLKGGLDQITGYAPDNAALTPANFGTFLDTVKDGNNVVASTAQVLADARETRRLAFFGDTSTNLGGLRTLAGRVRDHVGSMPGGKKSAGYKQVQRLTQKISNYHPPKKAVTTSAGGSTATDKKKISQSEKSYGSLVQAGRDLAAAVAQIPGLRTHRPRP
jgi:hypothetical protein